MKESVSVEAVIRKAMDRSTCIRATYNRVETVLAPHELLEKNEELFLRAVTLEHGGRNPRESRLGTFKLSGLTKVDGTNKLFSPGAVFAGLLEDAGSESKARKLSNIRFPPS